MGFPKRTESILLLGLFVEGVPLLASGAGRPLTTREKGTLGGVVFGGELERSSAEPPAALVKEPSSREHLVN